MLPKVRNSRSLLALDYFGSQNIKWPLNYAFMGIVRASEAILLKASVMGPDLIRRLG
jgi:hypothetical protein